MSGPEATELLASNPEGAPEAGEIGGADFNRAASNAAM